MSKDASIIISTGEDGDRLVPVSRRGERVGLEHTLSLADGTGIWLLVRVVRRGLSLTPGPGPEAEAMELVLEDRTGREFEDEDIFEEWPVTDFENIGDCV